MAILLGKLDPAGLVFVPLLVLDGQWWRIFGFMLIPPPAGIIFIGFAWWMFYLMGSGLEHFWGAFRYNLYIWVGAAFTVGLSFLQPGAAATNAFLAGSVFLAFAYLNPDFEILVLLVLPVKMKWLALITWAIYGYEFVTGGWSGRLQVIAAVGNFFLFFGGDLIQERRLQAAFHGPFGRTGRHRGPGGAAAPPLPDLRQDRQVESGARFSLLLQMLRIGMLLPGAHPQPRACGGQLSGPPRNVGSTSGAGWSRRATRYCPG